ncbi:MAG: hypothetical protein P4L54_08705 [Acidocella sp.]|nr:hypothetical protein [Acidocella sp.]
MDTGLRRYDGWVRAALTIIFINIMGIQFLSMTLQCPKAMGSARLTLLRPVKRGYMVKKLFLFGFLFAVLVGCATDYQPIGTDSTGGYYQSKITDDHYIVGFSANAFTYSSRAYDFAVLHAAELGNKLGFKYYIIEGQRDESRLNTFNTGSASTINSTSYDGVTQETVNTTSNSMTALYPGFALSVRYYDTQPSNRKGQASFIPNEISKLKAKYGLN